MSLISIPESIPESIDDLDKSLGKGDGLLLLDNNFSLNVDSKILLESSLIQWVISKHHSINQKIDITNNNLNLFRNYYEIALLILNKNKIANISSRELEKYKSSFFDNQNNWPDLVVSKSACLFCSDDRPGTTRDNPPGGLAGQLYNLNNPELTAKSEDFEALIAKLSKAVASTEDIRGKITEKNSNLAVILYELFNNTHVHARRNVDGSLLDSSIRGIYSRFYPAESLKSYFDSQKNGHLNFIENCTNQFINNSFFDMKKQESRQRDISGFIEFTVFDSGPGLVAKMLGDEYENADIKKQKESLKNCFEKGKSSLGNNEHGYGLWKVLEQVKQLRGLIRIRANKIHAVTEFMTSRHPSKPAIHLSNREVPVEDLYDWTLRSSTNLREYPAVQGTLISILIPMGEL